MVRLLVIFFLTNYGGHMNIFLEQALIEYFKTIKSKRPNYWACYSSFLNYCECFPSDTSLKELFEKKITIWEVKQACKDYIETSERSKSIVAVQRFLSAMDSFYQYIEKNGIECPSLKQGCRKKENVCEICTSLNEELRQKIYLPFDNPEYVKIADEEINGLNKNKFFQLGQSIIYRLLKTYGFKECVVISFKKEDFDNEEGTLLVNSDVQCNISIRLTDDIWRDLKKYCEIHRYPDRDYLFTKSNGNVLSPDSIFAKGIKDKLKRRQVVDFTPTSVALSGVAGLIQKGFTIAEIQILTGFEIQKIVDVSQYLLSDVDVEKTVNEKLKNM